MGLAPVASVSRMKSPIRIFTPFIHQLQVSGTSSTIHHDRQFANDFCIYTESQTEFLIDTNGFDTFLQLMFDWFGTKAFLPSGPVLKLMSKLFCDQTKWEEDFCENIFFLLSGSDPANFNEVIINCFT